LPKEKKIVDPVVQKDLAQKLVEFMSKNCGVTADKNEWHIFWVPGISLEEQQEITYGEILHRDLKIMVEARNEIYEVVVVPLCESYILPKLPFRIVGATGTTELMGRQPTDGLFDWCRRMVRRSRNRNCDDRL
jgi:hypothetical protein